MQSLNVVLEWLMTYAIHSTILIGCLLLLTSTAAGRRLGRGHGYVALAIRARGRAHHVVATILSIGLTARRERCALMATRRRPRSAWRSQIKPAHDHGIAVQAQLDLARRNASRRTSDIQVTPSGR